MKSYNSFAETLNEGKVTISGILDKPGISAKIFSLMTENNINVDMIVQNISQDGISAIMVLFDY